MEQYLRSTEQPFDFTCEEGKVWQLRFLGYGIDEIAMILGLDHWIVDSHLKRCGMKCQQTLGKDWNGGEYGDSGSSLTVEENPRHPANECDRSYPVVVAPTSEFAMFYL